MAPDAAGDTVDMLEVCPQALGLAGELGKRVSQEGGAALVIDYGRDEPYGDSMQAIKDHSFLPMLAQPGLADLSAHVDFSALRCSHQRPMAASCCNALCHETQMSWTVQGFSADQNLGCPYEMP